MGKKLTVAQAKKIIAKWPDRYMPLGMDRLNEYAVSVISLLRRSTGTVHLIEFPGVILPWPAGAKARVKGVVQPKGQEIPMVDANNLTPPIAP